jgi:uncharacterized membrane protein
MSEAGESRFIKARLEAFSDGIIAVIITLMVLDLKAPEDDSIASLLKLWPSFLSYVISFGFAAIYWINHHHIIAAVHRVTPAVIWSNNALLFFLSLFPFATAYMAATHISPFPTMIYGALQLCCAISFGLLATVIDSAGEGRRLAKGSASRDMEGTPLAGALRARHSRGLFQSSGFDRHFRGHWPDLYRAGPSRAPAGQQIALASRKQSA